MSPRKDDYVSALAERLNAAGFDIVGGWRRRGGWTIRINSKFGAKHDTYESVVGATFIEALLAAVDWAEEIQPPTDGETLGPTTWEVKMVDTDYLRHLTLEACEANLAIYRGGLVITRRNYYGPVLRLLREVEELRLALLAACGGDEDAARAYLDASAVIG